jgi:mannose-6-phosphate isomerase-like protein (cupin superfamily)
MNMSNTAPSASSIIITEPESWQGPSGRFSGEWEGHANGAALSIISNDIEEVGAGAKLHKHPYAETFVVRRGAVAFVIGDETIEGREGQIIVVPAGVPHAFRNIGPGNLEMIDIHESGAFVTEWMD